MTTLNYAMLVLAGESGLNLNQLPISVLTLQPGFANLDAQLNTQVANPFFGIFTNPTSNLRFATVQRKQLGHLQSLATPAVERQ